MGRSWWNGELTSRTIFSDTKKFTQVATVHGGVGKCGDTSLPGIYVRLDDQEIFQFIKLAVTFGLQGEVNKNFCWLCYYRLLLFGLPPSITTEEYFFAVLLDGSKQHFLSFALSTYYSKHRNTVDRSRQELENKLNKTKSSGTPRIKPRTAEREAVLSPLL